MKTLKQRSQEAFENAEKKGFYDNDPTWAQAAASNCFLDAIAVAAGRFEQSRRQASDNCFSPEDNPVAYMCIRIALLASELAEMYEAVRMNGLEDVEGPGGKPEGFGSEYADVQIRLWDLAGSIQNILRIDFDPDAEVEKKMAYNATRPIRHGGKSF